LKEGEGIRVERLSEKDVAEVEWLFKEVWSKATEYPEEWRKLRMLDQKQIVDEINSDFYYFGIRVDGKIVGLYKARIEGDVLIGEHQSVHPDYRGRGLARAMYAQFLRFAKENGFKQNLVNILPCQIASVKLVTQLGFRKIREYEQAPGMLVHLYERETGV
jgi:GNAT superfamily N-acetyltransferase